MLKQHGIIYPVRCYEKIPRQFIPIQTGGGGRGVGNSTEKIPLQLNPIQTVREWEEGFCLHGLRTLKPPNLVTFPKIHLGAIWHSKSLPIKFDVTTF